MSMKVSVIGAGTMGAGIAQVAAAAANGCEVVLCDSAQAQLTRAEESLKKTLARLVEKGALKAGGDAEMLKRIKFTTHLQDVAGSKLVIEAIIEDVAVKAKLFAHIEPLIEDSAILASNTSSLPITALGASLKHPSRLIGIHFFNPAPLMPLVEIIPGIATDAAVTEKARQLIDSWGKVTVLAKDTPGFIVNRVARPYYGEALRILEEGVASVETIDASMRDGGFKMGPFELMDLIGNDINFTVTSTVFEAMFYDPRYRPSHTQQRMVQAGRLGRKSGQGYYRYVDGKAEAVGGSADAKIFERILFMLINEAADAVQFGIASAADVDLAMTKGVNYPKGLLAWADEIGPKKVLDGLDALYANYREDRYRASSLLRRKAGKGEKFHG